MRSLRAGLSLALALLLCATTLTSAQLGLVSPKPRNTNEQQFNPRNNAQQARDDYCGNPSGLTDPASTLFVGDPANFLLTTFNNKPAGADSARIVLTLLQYRQNGTTFNPANNVTSPIWVRGETVLLLNTSASLRDGNQQKYLNTLAIDPALQCGYKATVNPTYTQTRCVLRWVFDNSASNQNSRVSCADVIIVSRAGDVRVSVTVRPDAPGEKPIQAQTALNRVLNHAWATDASRKLDIITLPDSTTNKASNQLRMHPTAPVVVDAKTGTYTLNFILSDSVSASASQLASSMRAQDLSKMFALNVVGSSQAGANSAASAQAGLLLVLCGCLFSILAKRAL